MARTMLELQQSVIKNCNYIYNKYADMEVMDWDSYWRTTQALRDKYIDDDEAIQDFITMRLGVTLRDLAVVKENKLWKISRSIVVR